MPNFIDLRTRFRQAVCPHRRADFLFTTVLLEMVDGEAVASDVMVDRCCRCGWVDLFQVERDEAEL